MSEGRDARDAERREAPGSSRGWEDEAARWVAWARTPGHDIFPYFAPAFLDGVVPAPAGLTLEVGCGEGRMLRELGARGHRIAGVDVSPSLARHARDADTRHAYVAADATALPFAEGAFATIVAYNSLQAMAAFGDMSAAVREAARVLARGGRFCACVPHPMTDLGHIERADDGTIAAGDYFERRRVDEDVEKGGLRMTFHGWTYTLEDYARALEDAGLAIELMREPQPSGAAAAGHGDLATWRRLPLFLFLRAVRVR